eukprot:scaffold35973_cov21-Tisochrysis_lutea.AAC.1
MRLLNYRDLSAYMLLLGSSLHRAPCKAHPQRTYLPVVCVFCSMPCNQKKGDKLLSQLGWKMIGPPPRVREDGFVGFCSGASIGLVWRLETSNSHVDSTAKTQKSNPFLAWTVQQPVCVACVAGLATPAPFADLASWHHHGIIIAPSWHRHGIVIASSWHRPQFQGSCKARHCSSEAQHDLKQICLLLCPWGVPIPVQGFLTCTQVSAPEGPGTSSCPHLCAG